MWINIFLFALLCTYFLLLPILHTRWYCHDRIKCSLFKTYNKICLHAWRYNESDNPQRRRKRWNVRKKQMVVTDAVSVCKPLHFCRAAAINKDRGPYINSAGIFSPSFPALRASPASTSTLHIFYPAPFFLRLWEPPAPRTSLRGLELESP